MEPQNRDAREKYDMTVKEHRLRLLAQAVYVEDKKVEINIEDIVVEASYSGPKLDKIEDCTPEWVEQLLDWQKN
jgi:hypothetical protein